MQNQDLIAHVCAYADRHAACQQADMELYSTDLAGLTILRSRKPTALEAVLYNPLFCLILQGRKETHLGMRRVSFTAGESLIVSHQLPVISRVTEATEMKPYVAIVLELDMGIVRSLYDEVSEVEIEEEHAWALNVGKTDGALLDAMGRLVDLIDRPFEAKVILPLVLREIHFRLLLAQHGGILRQLLRRGSQADRIAKVIARIKQDYSNPLTVAELASVAGLSPSSFHEHFKALTATTPLQYQKELRLLEARRLLMNGTHSVSTAAFEVGYESPTQFSREYSRKFGNSPRKDLA
ncbi:family transcriptional regulator [Leptolyngbya sp. Heron Island J]|uniref:AraC family transcriptional regulator n=1 Tax=Leptolyngbya sp. Heron Island J TaxID=1385935 RepID=UPI0003B97FD4|nr:AraC family transcriptional regulator [Leptolyngbya sp. Heron Island J]ESA33162.1 family transcriptional regulator [Leptolyngbya sp. Heron Island J]